jgi:hypothetical protein
LFLFLSPPCSRPSSREPRLANPRDFVNPWSGSASRSTRQQGPLQFRDLDDFFAFSSAYLQNPALAPRLTINPTPAPNRLTTAFRPNSSPFGLQPTAPQQPELDVDTFLDRLRAAKAIEASRSQIASRPQQQDFFSLPNVRPAPAASRPLDYEDYFLPPQSKPSSAISANQQSLRDEFPTVAIRSTPSPLLQSTLSLPRVKPTQKTTDYTYEYEPIQSTRKPVKQIQYEQFDIDEYVTEAPSRIPSKSTTKNHQDGFKYFTVQPRPSPSPPRQLPLNEKEFTSATPKPRLSPLDEFLRVTGNHASREHVYDVVQEPLVPSTRPTPAPVTSTAATTSTPTVTSTRTRTAPTRAHKTRSSTTRAPSTRAVITKSPAVNTVVTKSTREPYEIIEDATRGPSTPAPRFAFPFANDLSTQSLLPIEQYFTPTPATTPRPLKSETPGRFKASTQFLPSVDDVIDNTDNEYLQTYLAKLGASSPTTPRPFRVSSAITQRPQNPALVEEIVLITPPSTNSRGRISSTTTTTPSSTTTSTTTTTTLRPVVRPSPTSRPRPTQSTTQTTSRPVADKDDARQYKRTRPSSRGRTTDTTSAKRRYRHRQSHTEII